MEADVVITGTGVAGLYTALNLPESTKIVMVTKAALDENDSFLAQGGICVLKDKSDYESYFEDTMRAGHYENNKKSVEIMINSSPDVINDLVDYGVEFTRDKDGNLEYTKEGAHSEPRILFHKDITGKEITSHLLSRVREMKNVEIKEHFTMVDIIEQNGKCVGIIGRTSSGKYEAIYAKYTMLATGGVGGLYTHSTNYRHLKGDSLAICKNHGVELENIDYVQIHPTTLYSKKRGRRFLISESVRGEGAVLLDANMNRFVDELLPRDLLTKEIEKQMEKDGTPYVWLSMEPLGAETIKGHFPNIYQRCLEEGYDVTKECIPVVPAQHYFMGGIKVDENSATSMPNLYAAGETSCNGVHGRNRLASNSLLESLVFAKRAAKDISDKLDNTMFEYEPVEIDEEYYKDCDKRYAEIIRDEMEKESKEHGQYNDEA